MPTRPYHRGDVSGRVRQGTRLKTLVLNRRLALGFTGDVWAGAKLFKELEARYSDRTPTRDELNSALRLSNISLNKAAHLVGWLADPEPACFRWSAGIGAQVEWPPCAVLGSGARHFESELAAQTATGGSTDFSAREKAIFVAISVTLRALHNEMKTGTTWDSHYGYGFEIVTWTRERFEYQPKLTSFFLRVTLDENLIGGVGELVFVRIVERRDNYALVGSYPLQDHPGPDGVARGQVYVEQVTPLNDPDPDGDMDPTLVTLLEPASPIYGISLLADDPITKANVHVAAVHGADLVRFAGDSRKFKVTLDLKAEMALVREILTTARATSLPDK